MREKEEIFSILVDTIIAVMQRNDLVLTPETKVADLKLESLNFLYVISGVETIMAISFPDSKTQKDFETLDDLVAAIYDLQ
ncbi:MAG TPA: hypothetical protein PKI61_00535 [bacterium]|nr:hypothetical protein [bacterium]HPT29376.1 hypothetical protein [bacterium]